MGMFDSNLNLAAYTPENAVNIGNQLQNTALNQQAASLKNQSEGQDLLQKRRGLALSMLNGIQNEPDPAKQAALYQTLKPMAERYDSTLQLPDQYDPSLGRAMMASLRPPENLPPTSFLASPDAQGLNPLIKAGLQSGQLGIKDVLAAQALNPLMNLSAPAASSLTIPAASSDESGIPAEQTYTDRLSQLPPGMQGPVKAIIEGKLMPPNPNSRSPIAAGLMQAVTMVDPSFDAVNYGARAKTRQDFTAGKSAQSVNALNTVAGHLANLQSAADALDNSSMPLWNTVANATSSAAGDPRVNNFNIAKQAVADELSKAYKGGVVSDSEAKKWDSVLNSSNSPEQMKGALKELSDLLESKITALNDQYKQGMGVAAGDANFVSPKSRAVFDRLQGRTPATAPDQNQASTQPPAQPTAPQAGSIQPGAIVKSKNGVPFVFMGGDPTKAESYKAVSNGR